MDIINLIDLAQAGMTAILLFMVIQLWNRLNALTDRFIAYVTKAELAAAEAAAKNA